MKKYYRVNTENECSRDIYVNDCYNLTITSQNNQIGPINIDLFTTDNQNIIKQFIGDLTRTNEFMNTYKHSLASIYKLLPIEFQEAIIPILNIKFYEEEDLKNNL